MNPALLPRRHLPWPMPALVSWALAWAVFLLLRPSSPVMAWCAGLLVCATLAGLWPMSKWRRTLTAGGFPLSLLLTDASWAVSPALWLAPLALLWLIYPLQAWRDAPMFPTPHDALNGLAGATGLRDGAVVLDAGCGVGHGLQALRLGLPGAHVHGIERSLLLAWLARLRCPWAAVRQGDMWRRSWRDCELVYLFQRPESMARALAKAEAEMASGSWLASLEFEVPGRRPDATLRHHPGKPVWLYRVGAENTTNGSSSPQSRGPNADKSPERRP